MSKYFLTAIFFLINFIISCSSANYQVVFDKSDIKYGKPETSDHRLMGNKVEYELWYDSFNWEVFDKDNANYEYIKEELEKSKYNVYKILFHASQEVFVIIEESRLITSYESFYKYALKRNKRKEAQIFDSEIRNVNGNDILYMKVQMPVDEEPYIAIIYVLSNKSGIVKINAMTSENLFEEHESDIIDLLNGLISQNSISNSAEISNDIERKLLNLKTLKNKELITAEDYEKKKNSLLNSY